MTQVTDTGSPSSSPRPRRRRWYQYSLGSLVVVMTVAAMAAAYWRWTVTECERQATVADAIAELGATITWEPVVPAWLRWLPLAGRANRVVAVDLTECVFEQGRLQPLAELPDIERLYLARSSVRDEDLKHIGKLAKLRRLALWRTDVTTEGLGHLTGLGELEVLDIHADRFLDERSLEYLGSWPNLRKLILDLPVSDRGLALLAEHPNIPVTALRAHRVSDRGLKDLVRLARLEELTVELECDCRRIMRLAELRRLKGLTMLGRTEIGPAKELQAALPNLQHFQSKRLSQTSFKELVDRWGHRAHDLEICGTNPNHIVTLNRDIAHVTITQRQPRVKITAEIKTITWEDLRRLQTLKSLTIVGRGFDSAQLRHLQGLSRLTELHLQVPLDAQLIRYVAQLRQLEHLGLSGYHLHFSLAPEDCEPLGSLIHLQTFTAITTRMNDHHLAFFRKCPRLRRVYLQGVGITGQTFAYLSESPCLEELVLRDCNQLRTEDLERLQKFTNLRTCYVDPSSNLSPRDRDALDRSLPLLENQPARCSRYAKLYGSKAFDKLPPLKEGNSVSSHRAEFPSLTGCGMALKSPSRDRLASSHRWFTSLENSPAVPSLTICTNHG